MRWDSGGHRHRHRHHQAMHFLKGGLGKRMKGGGGGRGVADFALVVSLLARASTLSSNHAFLFLGVSSIERVKCSAPLLLASTAR